MCHRCCKLDKMQCLSQGQFNSDAEQVSCTIIPNSPPSDRSMSDHLLLEVELARESQCEKLAASEPATYATTFPTISYEEALGRELEYQERMNVSSLCSPIASGSLSTNPQPTSSGIKRKLPSGSLQELAPQNLQPRQLQNGMAPPQLIQFRQHLAQGQRYKQPSLHHLPNQQPQPSYSQGQPSLFWCNVCKVDCVTPFNFKNHLAGKKHKANMGTVYWNTKNTTRNGNGNGNGMVWCKECKVPCANEVVLAQHRAGEKHAAQVQAVRARLARISGVKISSDCRQ